MEGCWDKCLVFISYNDVLLYCREKDKIKNYLMMGVKMEEIEREVEKRMEKIDFVEAVHRAKQRSTMLLEEQGISTLALILSNALVDILEHPEKMELVK